MKKVNFTIRLLVLLSLCPLKLFAQNTFPFLAMNKNDFLHPKQDTKIEDVYLNANNKVIVKTDADKQKYSISEVWGFRDKKGKEFRVYRDMDYEVLQSDMLSVYTRQAVNDVQYYTAYYFSIGIDGDIYEMTGKNFKNVFLDSNEKFLSLIKLHFNVLEDYTAYDSKNKSFKIVEYYKRSLK